MSESSLVVLEINTDRSKPVTSVPDIPRSICARSRVSPSQGQVDTAVIV